MPLQPLQPLIVQQLPLARRERPAVPRAHVKPAQPARGKRVRARLLPPAEVREARDRLPPPAEVRGAHVRLPPPVEVRGARARQAPHVPRHLTPNATGAAQGPRPIHSAHLVAPAQGVMRHVRPEARVRRPTPRARLVALVRQPTPHAHPEALVRQPTPRVRQADLARRMRLARQEVPVDRARQAASGQAEEPGMAEEQAMLAVLARMVPPEGVVVLARHNARQSDA